MAYARWVSVSVCECVCVGLDVYEYWGWGVCFVVVVDSVVDEVGRGCIWHDCLLHSLPAAICCSDLGGYVCQKCIFAHLDYVSYLMFMFTPTPTTHLLKYIFNYNPPTLFLLLTPIISHHSLYLLWNTGAVQQKEWRDTGRAHYRPARGWPYPGVLQRHGRGQHRAAGGHDGK